MSEQTTFGIQRMHSLNTRNIEADKIEGKDLRD